MNDVSQSLGVEVPIRFTINEPSGDVVLLFTPLTFGIKGKFCEWIKDRCRQEIFDMRRMLDADTFAATLAKFGREAGTGVYAWGKPAFFEAIAGDEGAAYFTLLLLERYQPKLTVEELMPMMHRHIPEFQAQIRETIEADSKNSASPEKKEPG